MLIVHHAADGRYETAELATAIRTAQQAFAGELRGNWGRLMGGQ